MSKERSRYRYSMRRRAALVGCLVALTMLPLGRAGFAAADICDADNVRWAGSSNTLYVSGPVTCTLTQLQPLTAAPITLVDPAAKVWRLGSNLRLENGATLSLHGSATGGDVDELRLKSVNSSAANSIVYIRADWGTIDIVSTRVTSWDDAASAPDSEHQTYKRSYIHARSRLGADGVTPLESRMNIVSSEVSYLGHYGAEAYGLAWKVLGGAFDKVNVYGDVIDSHLHHNYMGLYTYGAYGMRLVGNEVDNNVSYGLDPHDDSDSLVIEDNHSHHNGNHGIICSQRCDNLIIRNNISEKNTGNGIMLHRNVTETLVEANQVRDNTDSGIAVFDSHRNTLRANTLLRNNRGIRFSVGSADNVVEGNEIVDSASYGLYFYKGSDLPTSGDGRPKRNRLVANNVRASASNAIKLSESDDNVFERNVFSANVKGLVFDKGLRNRLVGSDLSAAGKVETYGKGVAASTFLADFTAALVLVDSTGAATLEDPEGAVFDPEEDLATTIGPSGSSLLLDFSGIGPQTNVVVRNLTAAVGSGSVAVQPKSWSTSGDRRKEWEARATNPLLRVSYAVGDLLPSKSYRILKAGRVLKTVTTDGNGWLRFSDLPGSRDLVRYAVAP